MNFTIELSLKHQAVIKIVTALWNQKDIKVLISKMDFSSNVSAELSRKKWGKISEKVAENVHKLKLPSLFKKKSLGLINPVGYQIFHWLEFHYRFHFIIEEPKEYIWTSQGLIDKMKTAEMLVNDKSLDVYRRFKFACAYCLEEYIHVLWKQLLQIYDKKDSKFKPYSFESPLVDFWMCYLKGKRQRLNDILISYFEDDYSDGDDDSDDDHDFDHYFGSSYKEFSPYRCGFELAVSSGNEVATKYFFVKLTSDEKKDSLVNAAMTAAGKRFEICEYEEFPKEFYTPVLYFLLSEMNKEELIDLFESASDSVLKCFLDWPWHAFFLEIAKNVSIFFLNDSSNEILSDNDYNELSKNYFSVILNRDDYCKVLNELCIKVTESHTGYIYQELFTVFWQQSNETHKTYALYNICVELLSTFYQIPDEYDFKLILEDTRDIERMKFIFSECGQDICENLIFDKKWDSLEFLIREYIPLKSEMLKFKHRMEICSNNYFGKEYVELHEKWDKFFQLLENCICRYKRKCEEKDNYSKKRFRNFQC